MFSWQVSGIHDTAKRGSWQSAGAALAAGAASSIETAGTTVDMAVSTRNRAISRAERNVNAGCF
ncbi:hypothetical protein BH11ACT6_BH11ACT6_37440 [soil metagenome]